MESDGLFYGKNQQPYRYQWTDDRYRLEPVTSMPGQFTVPAPGDRLFHREGLPDPIIVTGERGGGVGHFLSWLAPRRRAGRRRASQDQVWQVCDLKKAFELIEQQRSTGPDEAVQWPLYLVIDLVHGEESEEARDMRGRLGGMLDDPDWRNSGNRIICLTREIHQLRDDFLFSSILSRGHVYRIPHFSVPELEDWVVELSQTSPGIRPLEKGSEMAVRLAKEAKRWVGGQPTLTHVFFRSVDEYCRKEREADGVKAFQKAGEHLRDHPPHIVFRWGEHLRILLKNPSVRRKLGTYTSGATVGVDNPLADTYSEAQLFLAGWVGLNPDGRWGIRSLCHRQWAREFLRG